VRKAFAAPAGPGEQAPIDWEALAGHVDGVQVCSSAGALPLRLWDCESTVWFNPVCTEVGSSQVTIPDLWGIGPCPGSDTAIGSRDPGYLSRASKVRAMASVVPFRRRPRRDSMSALVLSGGGNRGAAQVGMLRALVRSGYRPDVIIACSVGSLTGTFYAVDPSPERVEALDALWRGIQRSDIFPGSRIRTMWQVARHSDHLCDPTSLRSLIGRFAGVTDLSELTIPTEVVTVGLRSGAERYWSSGPAAEVLTASCALPGIFPPVLLDDELHLDGGVLHTVPVARAIELGATDIAVCDVATGAAPGPMRSPLDALTRAFAISRYARLRRDFELAQSTATVRNIKLGDEVRPVRWDDFSRTPELIEAGERAAELVLTARTADAEQAPRGWWARRRAHRLPAQLHT